ncbi:Regulatory protein repA [Mycobacteroides abscessus]|uniref:AAA family ATPase n=1 Tax=Mycobacteroides abscessus TaxID=36809 RepID=UPI0005E74EFB|nr:AAA family ATPase [Mycobacteroides abscessus]CPU64313.1 Regulatory protein repA [Mycobacteroides abscessus]CPX45271.1 Regulatory protein repA [Mycobacteroides abscessus]CPZ60441.1 Regulatory protein repA [Mycobacteroides abscessus]SLH90602.1 Regulatory protein repA [Mycobacteroides abscessus subsp. massiliense]SLI32282.1 Regulatory protein repA [Mycobacteroides abscessus subsp. massiliense]
METSSVADADVAKFNLLDWETEFNRVPQEPDWLVPGVLIRGANASLVAGAGQGKSLLALDIAAALASGRPVLGQPVHTTMDVLYLDMENSAEDVITRLHDMGYAPDDLPYLRYSSFPDIGTLDDTEGAQRVRELVASSKAQFVVIDTACRFVDGEENSNDTWQALYRYTLAPLKRRHCTVLRLDHSGVDATKARGGSAKRDDVDVEWRLEVTGGKGSGEHAVTLRCGKQRQLHYPGHVSLTRTTSPLAHTLTTTAMDGAAKDIDQVAACMDKLDALGVPATAGREVAREALRRAAWPVSNDTLGEAVKRRKKPVRA